MKLIIQKPIIILVIAFVTIIAVITGYFFFSLNGTEDKQNLLNSREYLSKVTSVLDSKDITIPDINGLEFRELQALVVNYKQINTSTKPIINVLISPSLNSTLEKTLVLSDNLKEEIYLYNKSFKINESGSGVPIALIHDKITYLNIQNRYPKESIIKVLLPEKESAESYFNSNCKAEEKSTKLCAYLNNYLQKSIQISSGRLIKLDQPEVFPYVLYESN